MIRIVALLLLLSAAGIAQPSALTATTTGNWDDASIWGGTVPGASDTCTIAAQKTVTIPAGVAATCGALTYGTGVSANHTKLVINGTYTLAGDVTMTSGTGTYSDFMAGPGAVVHLGNFSIREPATTATANYSQLTLVGNAGSRVTVDSTGGAFLTSGSGGTLNVNLDIEYADFSGLGDSFNLYNQLNGYSFIISHATFTSCGVIYQGKYSATSVNSYIEYSDFINTTAANGATILNIVGNGNITTTARNDLKYNTFRRTGAAPQIQVNAAYKTVDHNIFYNTILTFASYGSSNDKTISNNLIFIDTSTQTHMVPGLSATGTATISNNYFLAETDNPHQLNASGIQVATGNIFETNTPEGSITDEGDIFGAENVASNISAKNNLALGTNNNSVFASYLGGTNNNGPATFDNNTIVGIASNTHELDCASIGETVAGRANMITSFQNNICATLYATTNSKAVRDQAATPSVYDIITMVDYNGKYNLTGSTHLALGTAWDAHSFVANPNFVDPTRNFMTWGASLGGAGTDADTLANMLKLNGYGGTFNASYSIENLLAWVKAGYRPTNIAFHNAGHGGSDVGAFAYQAASGLAVDFSADRTDCTHPCTVIFTPAITGAVSSWKWDLGNNITNAGQSTEVLRIYYTYVSAGTYSVVLTATGSGGPVTASKSNYISVH